ncbi:hypothetical protein KSP24_03555 [Paenibacillus sp. AK121]|uniref:hypothetical protein n=1 Tax=Paenibacillus TaxID=44249 RepID=UPI001C24251A|nr:hypothetical protein [Paenibacillus sp. AK121]MBU9706002.1 hypothetical protein [Paenibacillus sp. AK121]MEE4568137.1 hypothetical protein [Paenibacillus polymyxa]
MEITSRITDIRIDAENIFIEMTYERYLKIARKIIENNDLQRRRVKSSNTVYSLLRNDLKRGCVIPPIVLALGTNGDETKINFNELSNEEIIKYINTHLESLVILDGLQRTNTILEAENELARDGTHQQLEHFYSNKLRIELYLGINKFGILYRMLTLNTGQTPMSIRHQIEILYKNYMDHDLNGIRLVREVEDQAVNEIGIYKFKDVIDGFNSYLERNELPIDRFELLNNIKGLEKLSEENQQRDVFRDFVESYNHFVIQIDNLSEHWELDVDEDDIILSGQPFGKQAYKIFNKSQALTGYGAAIGKLKDFGIINSFDQVNYIIRKLECGDDPTHWLIMLLSRLDNIRGNSKKIGNSQRMYFQYFFRELFNSDGDSYLSFERAVENGYQKYRSQSE